jgi:hypothetical protein
MTVWIWRRGRRAVRGGANSVHEGVGPCNLESINVNESSHRKTHITFATRYRAYEARDLHSKIDESWCSVALCKLSETPS